MQMTIEIEVQGCDSEDLTLEINDAPVSDSVAIDDNAGAGDTDVTWSADKSARELADKVDKEVGKSLAPDTEIEKLSTVEQYATANRPDAQNADKVHAHVISDVAGLDTALEAKVDKVEGYSLVAGDEIDKLSTVERYAQKNTVSSVAGKQGDVLLDKSDVGLSAADNTADADKPVSTAQQAALDGKVDKVSGKQLSDENYTLAEKDKLSGIAEQATKNRADSENADKMHTHTISDVTGLATRLDDIDTLIGDVEAVLIAINGEPTP